MTHVSLRDGTVADLFIDLSPSSSAAFMLRVRRKGAFLSDRFWIHLVQMQEDISDLGVELPLLTHWHVSAEACLVNAHDQHAIQL